MADQERSKDWQTADFDFHLPDSSIANHPASPREQARLLHVKRDGFDNKHVFDLPSLLRADDLLVLNDTKVIPARLFGMRRDVRVEVLLLRQLAQDGESCLWSALARPGKRLRIGDEIVFANDFSVRVSEKGDGGEIRFVYDGIASDFMTAVRTYGHVPLPPYIARADEQADSSDYQTVYAAKEGAVAAPTAGLHFTPELLASLEAKGVSRVTVTLHVGAGTFLPVKAERLTDHVMHAEWGELSENAAETINKARREGRRIVSVGTTPLRLLETVADGKGFVRPFAGDTSIFIYPGYRFKAVDLLMTNFHLPKSTLFMLVSAFAGVDKMRKAYEHAIREGYRFYSYGDTSLLERAE